MLQLPAALLSILLFSLLPLIVVVLSLQPQNNIIAFFDFVVGKKILSRSRNERQLLFIGWLTCDMKSLM
jgi:hypothetical protein